MKSKLIQFSLLCFTIVLINTTAYGQTCCVDGECREPVTPAHCIQSGGEPGRLEHCGTDPMGMKNCKDGPGILININNIIVEANSSFNAFSIGENNTVKIIWKNSFTNNTGFFVGRSKDGNNFKIMGALSDNNISPSSGSYEFIDNYPLVEGYYRILYFKDGKVYSSQTASVNLVKKGKLVLLNNPSTHTVRILLENVHSYDTEVSVFNLSGKILLTQKTSNGQTPEINLSALPVGIFVVHVKQNGKLYVDKLLRN